MRTTIQIQGARAQNNLQNVDVEIPRDKLTVVTGMRAGPGSRRSPSTRSTPKGNGSMLASMSTFAKLGFVGQLKKPDVDFVNGLSPVVSIDQKTVGSNPRSTVGTMTDISDYLRMLFATLGTPHCPLCGEALAIRTPHQMMEHLMALPRGTEVEVRAPVYKIHGEDYEYLFELIRVNGYRRARIDGKPRDLGEHINLDEDREHTIEAVIDTFVVGPGIDQQVVTSLEHGLKLGDGLLSFHITKPKQLGDKHKRFYDGFGCARHRLVAGEMQAFQFTFNDPAGACPACSGIGTAMRVHPVAPGARSEANTERGGIRPCRASSNNRDSWGGRMLYSLAAHYGFGLDVPYQELAEKYVQVLLYGTKGEHFEVLFAARGEARNSTTPARKSSSTGSLRNWSITTDNIASRARPTPVWLTSPEEGDGGIRLPRMRRRPVEASPPTRDHRRL